MMEMNPYLQRCLDLARLPGSAVEPNPRVGAVVVHGGRIIGEGFHRKYGGPHAEVNAVNAVQNPTLLPQSTLYVSLEPCNHHGKTPPCTELILQHRIPKVVVGSLDPNPKMAGKSVALLRSRDVVVEVNPHPAPFEALNAHFWLNQRLGRPYVTLKWAESLDGFIARLDANGIPERTSISSAGTSRFVHQLRAQHQAILVGQNTVRVDDPSLSTRKWPGPDPVKIVFDLDCSISRDAKVFEGGRLILLNLKKDEEVDGVRYLNVEGQTLEKILERLYREEMIGSILVEGGTATHQPFIAAGLWEECWQNIGAGSLGNGVPAPRLPAFEKVAHRLESTYADGGDLVRHYLRN